MLSEREPPNVTCVLSFRIQIEMWAHLAPIEQLRRSSQPRPAQPITLNWSTQNCSNLLAMIEFKSASTQDLGCLYVSFFVDGASFC